MKKSKVTRSLLAACSIVALSVAVSACVHNGGSDTAEVVVPEPMPEPVDPGPTDLESTQTAAAAAATAAMTASTNAAASSMSAMTATMNMATLQTGEMAKANAAKAKMYADMAMAEAGKAKAASDAAAAATLASAAGVAKGDAEAAQKAAEAAAMKAADYAMKASEAAMMELMIDGKAKSVGESMLNAGDGTLTTTADDDSKMITGRLDMDPMEDGMDTEAVAGRQNDPNTAKDEAMTPMVVAEARSVTVGRTLDTSDDAARLMLMTHYAGTKTVNVYIQETATAAGDGTETANQWTSTRTGRINAGATANSANPDDFAPEAERPTYVALRAVGKYYPVDADTTATGTGATPFGDIEETPDNDALTVKPGGAVDGDDGGDSAAPKTVYVFDDDGTPRYVVLESTETSNGTTTRTYSLVHTMVELPGVGSTDDGGTEVGAKSVNVMAKLPAAMAYEHIHFGVWAGLGEAEDDGSQELAELGIGFVQSIGDGMTGADMPNAGTATYSGNWAASVQERNEGDISLENGGATLTANLDKSTLKAELTGLATLDGMLDGSGFSGTKADVDEGNMFGLDSGGDFEGKFSGGFYGPKAAEAAGIFDFAGGEAGAFRGAFGGALDEN